MLNTNKHGFTIVELLIVIVVIGILAAIVTVAFSNIQARAIDAKSLSMRDLVIKKSTLYYQTTGTWPQLPTQFEDVNTPLEAKLDATVVDVISSSSGGGRNNALGKFGSIGNKKDMSVLVSIRNCGTNQAMNIFYWQGNVIKVKVLGDPNAIQNVFLDTNPPTNGSSWCHKEDIT